jgi:hypothetical protein
MSGAVKLFALILALATGTTLAADPGAAAIDFLEKVRKGRLALEPGGDTAITPQTTEAKRREIARRLERMTNELSAGKFEVGAVEQDGELAAVLVRKLGGFDPARLQVFPVALVKQGERWTPAPVPASFENAGIGYAPGIRQRVAALENWMLREQVRELTELRDQATSRMRQEISERLPRGEYLAQDPEQIARGFLGASEDADLAAMLGHLGGMRESLPPDWDLRLKAADTAVAAGKRVTRPWRLLMSPEVVRVPVHSETGGDTALVSIACLDPAGGERGRMPRIHIVHFGMERHQEGIWQINLPPAFIHPTPPDEDEEEEEDGLIFDSDLIEAFPASLRALHPATPQAAAKDAFEATLDAMKAPDLIPLLSMVKLPEDPATALRACARAAQSWWPVRESPGLRHPLPLAFHESGDAAVGIVQFLALAEPDNTRLRTFHFKKSPQGWLWQAELAADDAAGEADSELRKWTTEELARWKNGWQEKLFSEPLPGEELQRGAAPAEAAARETLSALLNAVAAGDLAAALPMIARFDGPASASKALRNLNFEVTSLDLANRPPAIEAVATGNFFTLAKVRIDQEKGPVFPVYSIVSTPTGPRVLLEIDLFATTQRTRAWLNGESLRLAGERLTPEAAAELQELFKRLEQPPAEAE